MKKVNVQDQVYWVHDGDVIQGRVIKADSMTVKIRTKDGLTFGKVGRDDYEGSYDIWHSDVTTSKEEAIKMVKKGMDLTRATFSAWQTSLQNLTSEEDDDV